MPDAPQQLPRYPTQTVDGGIGLVTNLFTSIADIALKSDPGYEWLQETLAAIEISDGLAEALHGEIRRCKHAVRRKLEEVKK